MRFYFEPEEATQVAKCLGAAYICHSAYFVTIDVKNMHQIVRVSSLSKPLTFIGLVHAHIVLHDPHKLLVSECKV